MTCCSLCFMYQDRESAASYKYGIPISGAGDATRVVPGPWVCDFGLSTERHNIGWEVCIPNDILTCFGYLGPSVQICWETLAREDVVENNVDFYNRTESPLLFHCSGGPFVVKQPMLLAAVNYNSWIAGQLCGKGHRFCQGYTVKVMYSWPRCTLLGYHQARISELIMCNFGLNVSRKIQSNHHEFEIFNTPLKASH